MDIRPSILALKTPEKLEDLFHERPFVEMQKVAGKNDYQDKEGNSILVESSVSALIVLQRNLCL